MATQPYVSFVVAARNDTYGGNFLGRMQNFVRAWAYLCRKHGVDAELVVVEWNPPSDRPRLAEALSWPADMPAERMRIVTVPREIHERISNAKRMPIFEYMAKNVGIRRARGQFVLSTNPDILYSEGIMRLLSGRRLQQDAYYCVVRYDVREELNPAWTVERQLHFCARKAFRAFPKSARTYVRLLGWRGRRDTVRNFIAAHRADLLSPRWIARKILLRTRRFLPGETYRVATPNPWVLDWGAPGDFFLMSAEKWNSLRAFPELAIHSCIDDYFHHIADVAGLREIVPKPPIYHQEHDRSEHVGRKSINRLEEIPGLREMVETRKLVIPNGEDWGLAHLELATTCPRMPRQGVSFVQESALAQSPMEPAS